MPSLAHANLHHITREVELGPPHVLLTALGASLAPVFKSRHLPLHELSILDFDVVEDADAVLGPDVLGRQRLVPLVDLLQLEISLDRDHAGI